MVIGIVLFFIFGCLLIYGLRCFFQERRTQMLSDFKALESSLDEQLILKEKIKKQTSCETSILAKTVRMYEAGRDICSLLDETKLFEKFKEDLKKLMNYENCLLFPWEAFDPSLHTHGAVFPLLVKEARQGYLVIEGAPVSEQPYLGILASHFALGLKRARLYKMIQELAITDSVTGLYTRRYAMERLKEEFMRSEAHKTDLSVLMIDADDFKECNDKFGHLVGDVVLREIGNRIRENIREVDMLSRFGGEEFLVFAPNASKESAFLLAERIRKGVEAAEIRAYDEKVKTTISIGLASYPLDASKPEDLTGKADWALYQAKRLGKNRVCVFGAFHEV